jgi:hypothetical protein
MAYKDERLKVIRHMNAKLEQKAQQIMKKWDVIKILEEKNFEENSKSQQLSETVESLNDKIQRLEDENNKLRRHLEDSINEKSKLFADVEDYKKQIVLLKLSNDEINSKNNELENKFKRSLEQSTKTETKKYNSTALKNLTESIEDMRPAKLKVTKNNNLEVNY